VTLVVIAVDMGGSLAINWAGWKLGLAPHWSEGINERWLWGPWSTTLMSSVDAVLWAPLFEELGFRGLLYVTLRTRMPPLAAAVASSALFSATHVTSLPTSLAFFWSGMVWCYAFERFRTLVPGMVGHAAGNMLAVASVLMFYR
jgi:membrane protease YdiL (CAAX protease family)